VFFDPATPEISIGSHHCGVPIPRDLPLGSIITLCGNAYNPHAGEDNRFSFGLYSYTCKDLIITKPNDPLPLTFLAGDGRNFENNGTLCFELDFELTDTAFTSCDTFLVVAFTDDVETPEGEELLPTSFTYTLNTIVVSP